MIYIGECNFIFVYLPNFKCARNTFVFAVSPIVIAQIHKWIGPSIAIFSSHVFIYISCYSTFCTTGVSRSRYRSLDVLHCGKISWWISHIRNVYLDNYTVELTTTRLAVLCVCFVRSHVPRIRLILSVQRVSKLK